MAATVACSAVVLMELEVRSYVYVLRFFEIHTSPKAD